MARIRIGDLMVRAGLIDEMQLQAALAHQRQWGGRLGDVLVSQGFLDEMMLWRGLSRQLEVPLVSLPELVVGPDVLALVPYDTAMRLEVFPVSRDERTLTVATSEPNNIGAVDEVAFRSGLKVRAVLAPAREIDWAIRTYYRGERNPCPPPRARRNLEAPPVEPPAERPSLQDRSSSSISLSPTQTPLAELNVARAGTPPPQAGVGAVPAGGGAGGAVVDAQLHRQTVDTLRAVIELCIARGVFTRDELWQVLQAHSGAPRP